MARFTDAEAAERLLNRLNRTVARHMDADNLHSAEDVLKQSAKRFLENVILMDATPTPQDRPVNSGDL